MPEAPQMSLAEADEYAGYLIRTSNGADVVDIRRVEGDGNVLTDEEWNAFVAKLRTLFP